MTRPVYLDYNATTPVDPQVQATIAEVLQETFGNPSSSHVYGQQARAVIERGRQQVADLIQAQTSEIVFTASASEANNLAILGTACARQAQGRHLITSAVEHPSVLQPFNYLQQQGWELTVLPVDEFGRVDPGDLEQAIRPDTVLVSIMHANNEVGTIQPIEAIAAITRQHGIPLHVDAAQSAGKIPVEVNALGADLLTLAGHKFYAPKGIGALYIKEGIHPNPILFGAAQERGQRTGTENVPYIAGLGVAAQLARAQLDHDATALRNKRNRLHHALLDAIPDLTLNGHPDQRLPNTLNVSFPGVEGKSLLEKASDRIAASTGSACHADSDEVSGVLGAMGIDVQRAVGAVRLSVGRPTPDAEIDSAATALIDAWQACLSAGRTGSR
ncbi:cysteine desulfurase family protein [Thiohalophilus sp.]|uniref:cysteine desulfurase family protein n=1 Tax=Thiohalophilus sp. TaxID=3028392 RepID=UPI002ACD3EF5|nr:cysteine desulfurase family protein [Thiohalophilus sp.]MDZ7662963.1 cysteine desulfurase family protein [Thiohalophilus sp.]